nr:hypothetical protein [Tanacetum cinerariifolium]
MQTKNQIHRIPPLNTSNSANGGLNLNNEADDSVEEEVREVRLMGRDKAKKISTSSSIPSKSSALYAPAVPHHLLISIEETKQGRVISVKCLEKEVT